MLLQSGGIDIHYIDESADKDVFAMTCIAVPFIREVEGAWTIVWPSHFERLKDWRRNLKKKHGIPMYKEIHAQKFASGRGRYKNGDSSFSQSAAAAIYREMLSTMDFLPEMSITSVVGTSDSSLYGATKLEATLMAMFQRMARTAKARSRNGLVFFDEGHGEYTKLYRRSLVYLPTGSNFGGWTDGKTTANMPMANFTEDGNIKQSRIDYFIQTADLLAYALNMKIKAENGKLSPWQQANNLHLLYDDIPAGKLNVKATRFDRQGIVRL